MSFLNSEKVNNNTLIKDVVNSLHDAIFFMTLSKMLMPIVPIPFSIGKTKETELFIKMVGKL